MINISRNWATPLTVGSFVIMAVTGILMFFHLDSGLNKVAHEYLGWLMVFAVIVHVVANWNAFKRYFIKHKTGQVIMFLGVLITGLSFISPSSDNKKMSPPMTALKAITRAPIGNVAVLANKPVEVIIQDLKAANILLKDEDSSIESVSNGDKAIEGKAISIIFKK